MFSIVMNARILVFAVIALASLYACAGEPLKDKRVINSSSDVIGSWEVVELVPSGNNPLASEKWLYIFKDNGVLLSIIERKNRENEVETLHYKLDMSVITITEKDGRINEHKVWLENGNLVFQVPFGAMIMKKMEEK